MKKNFWRAILLSISNPSPGINLKFNSEKRNANIQQTSLGQVAAYGVSATSLAFLIFSAVSLHPKQDNNSNRALQIEWLKTSSFNGGPSVSIDSLAQNTINFTLPSFCAGVFTLNWPIAKYFNVETLLGRQANPSTFYTDKSLFSRKRTVLSANLSAEAQSSPQTTQKVSLVSSIITNPYFQWTTALIGAGWTVKKASSVFKPLVSQAIEDLVGFVLMTVLI